MRNVVFLPGRAGFRLSEIAYPFQPVLFLSEVGMATTIEELRDALVEDPMNVLAIVGTGVSIATSANARCASWDSLINDGIQLCSDRGVGNPEWVFQARELVRTGDFIGAAETARGQTDLEVFVEKLLNRSDPEATQSV
jgi:hypothetical protein